MSLLMFFLFKQKTAYEMRISDWSSDVCSSDLVISASAAIRATRALAKYDKVQRESETPTMATSSDGACRCSRPARAARNDLGSLSELADLDTPGLRDRKSVVSGKSVSVSVDLGGRRLI